MKAEQIDKALYSKYVTEGERLVFWHDPNGEFLDYIGDGFTGDLSDVQILNVAEFGGLSVKLRLERDDTTGKYLIYSMGEMTHAEEDWLLDVRLYSAQFHADVASLWLQELGLSSLSLRAHLKARATFLGNQDRRKKLGQLVSKQDDEAAIDLKMMAVLVGTQVPSPFEILRALCNRHEQDGLFDLSMQPEIIAIFEKMDLLSRFWGLMRSEFVYNSDVPSVAGLLRRIFVSELHHQAKDAHLESLSHHQLSDGGTRNAKVFLTQWRDSSAHAGSYDAAAKAIATEQNVGDALASLDLEALKEVYTFWDAEKLIVSRLKDRLLDERQALDVESVAALASERKSGHWLSGPGSTAADRRAVADAYDAIVAAGDIFLLHAEQRNSLKFEAASDLLSAYQKDLYRFDRLYRRFCAKAKPSLGQGWDLLKTLSEEIEKVYYQGFLQPFGIEWSRLLDGGFLDKWSSDELPAQQDFYRMNIRPHLAESERKRAFVIISDAFRYEAAKELTESLNGVYPMEAQLSAMLGVLPSYTALGMASLLPHETISFSEQGEVLVDDRSVAGTDARNKQLATVKGMACKSSDLHGMKLEEVRNFTQGKRVVYIYHNVIDARGDSVSTESETFEAVSECIGEIIELTQYCVNRLSASKVWITADHGFLFQQTAPKEIDKTKLSYKPEQALKMKKRYLIGNDLGTSSEAHHGSTSVTAGSVRNMEFWIPRAANLFHFTGGARFVHGGAMPQEVVVPLVTVTHVRGKSRDGTRSGKVSVQVLGSNHKITTPKYRFELIQTEAVGERRKSLTVRAAVYEGSHAVTSVETITFDSTSGSIDERKKSINLTLQKGSFEKATAYRLVLRDVESDAEVQSVPVTIDRSFDDDF